MLTFLVHFPLFKILTLLKSLNGQDDMIFDNSRALTRQYVGIASNE